ncbi:MAG: hypothetical protein EZS28_018984 [Streblomastix strix]|uniref:Uncharacterized protein n=1 Tax=Streblomastix strix TaxID=222440 RepID=A0A5J4VSC8_9EUKA|nr:MAG: hypothetical protein EZS28_018984 [Streblomastix strix]
MDSTPRTLTFFKNDEEQMNYVSNIPAAVRAFLSREGESFQVLKFEALSEPTAKHGAGSRVWEYGTEWIEYQLDNKTDEKSKKKQCIIQ